MFDVRILSTGSEGNCVVINDDIMIDMGLTKKKTETLYQKPLDNFLCSIVTHKHGDHCSLPLVRYHIEHGHPLAIPQDVCDKLEEKTTTDLSYIPNVLVLSNKPKEIFTKEYGEYKITFYPQKHYDIVNYAIFIEYKGETLLYATDLDTLDESDVGVGLHILPKNIDIILLEGNFDEVWLRDYVTETIETYDDEIDTEQLSSDALNTWVRAHYRDIPKEVSAPLFRAVQNMRHLSKQEARKYVQTHLSKTGRYYEIHRSSQFYTRPTEWSGADLKI